MQCQPGDLIQYHGVLGTVISVRRSNPDTRMASVYPFTYYAVLNNGSFVGPLFDKEFIRA